MVASPDVSSFYDCTHKAKLFVFATDSEHPLQCKLPTMQEQSCINVQCTYIRILLNNVGCFLFLCISMNLILQNILLLCCGYYCDIARSQTIQKYAIYFQLNLINTFLIFTYLNYKVKQVKILNYNYIYNEASILLVYTLHFQCFLQNPTHFHNRKTEQMQVIG